MTSMDEDPILDMDQDLRHVLRAQQDPAAFEPLYDRYLDQIYAFCFWSLGTWEYISMSDGTLMKVDG